jgi:small subunit ribosomal protein S16
MRIGRKNQPSFKIVVTEKTKSSTGGRFVEQVGFYNPATKEKNLNAERIKYWMSVGAQPSATIHNLLIRDKVIEGKKIPKHKTPKQPAGTDATGQEPKQPAEAPSPAPAEPWCSQIS